jgi:hypothetical protein
VEAVLYIYRWLAKEVDKLAKKAGQSVYNPELDGSKRTWLDCFRKGAASEIDHILTGKRREQEANLRNQGRQTTALVKADDEVEEHVKATYKISYAKRSISNWSTDGYSAGRQAAHSIDLDSGAGLSAPAKKLKGE